MEFKKELYMKKKMVEFLKSDLGQDVVKTVIVMAIIMFNVVMVHCL